MEQLDLNTTTERPSRRFLKFQVLLVLNPQQTCPFQKSHIYLCDCNAFEKYRDAAPICIATVIRNEQSARRQSFGPDVRPCGRPVKNFRQAIQVLEKQKQASWHGHHARTSMTKLRSEELRAGFSFLREAHKIVSP